MPAWDYQAMARTQWERVEKGDSQIVLGDELTADYAVAEHARHKVGTLPRPERGEEIGRGVSVRKSRECLLNMHPATSMPAVLGGGRALMPRKSLPCRYPSSKSRKIIPKSRCGKLVRDRGVGGLARRSLWRRRVQILSPRPILKTRERSTSSVGLRVSICATTEWSEKRPLVQLSVNSDPASV